MRLILQFNSDQICMIAKVVAKTIRRLFVTIPLYDFAKTKKNHQDPPSHHRRAVHTSFEQKNAKNIKSEQGQQEGGLSLQVWAQKLRVNTIQQLQPLLDQALSHKSTHLAMYLRKLNKHLSSTFHFHRSFFKEADAKINSFSANLSLSAPEFIEILRFRGTLRGLEGEMSFLHNFGFEKKAGILAATFLHNRQFTFSQAVLAMRLILPLGGVSLLLLMNFIKFFKEVAVSETAHQTIKVEHLLSLLGLKFLKRNEMIIENTLFDHVLHYFLLNMAKLIKNQTPTIKIETLCTLLCFDSRNNYRSDPDAKRHWTIALLKDVELMMDGGWVREIWGETATQPGLLAVQVVYILECISFARQNMLDFQCLHDSFVAFETKALQQFEQQCEKLHAKQIINEEYMQKLMRFVFNPNICPKWINKKSIRQMIFTHILKKPITRDQTIQALVNLTNSNPEDYQHKLRLLQLAKVIITKQIEKGIVPQALILAFIQRASSQIALALIDNIPKSSQRQLFLSFSSNCCKQNTEKCTFSTESASRLIKDIYNLALASQSQKGYEVAMRMLEDNFQFVSSALLSQDISKANRSQMNAMLSEESYYVSWIIFINLSNGKEVSPTLTAYFNRLLKNDIIKFELLSNSYQLPYPRTNRFATPVITTQRTYDVLSFIIKFFEEDKYTYFVWDILLKRLSNQPVAVRNQCFPLIQGSFLRAFRKEKARKVVMVTVLSSHIAGGVVVGTRLKLQALLEMAIDQLLVSEEMIEYHYSCYLLLVCNALAADILSPNYFDKIMHHSLKKDPKMRHTCSLMLLYGASLRSRNEVGGVIEPKVIYQQGNYLKFLIKNGYIVAPRYAQKVFASNKKQVELTGRLLAILFSFGVIEVIRLQEAVGKVLEGPLEFGEWRCVANCYTPENYSLQVKPEMAFRSMVTQLLIRKVIHYCKLGLLSKSEETYFIDKFK